MKTYYTFLFILMSVLLGYGQDGTFAAQKQTAFSVSKIPVSTFSVTKAYPNPVKDLVTVEVQSDQPGTIQLSLINILGTEVKKWEPLYLSGGDQKIKLDLSTFQSGIYFLRLTKADQVATQLLKKN